METIYYPSFDFIGISIRTTNANGQAAQDIPLLWQRFLSGNLADLIPNKASNDVLCIYTDYEGDYTRPYTTLLGCKVTSLDDLPDGMSAKSFEAGHYIRFLAKGNIMEGAVFDTWTKIWASNIPRKYYIDFEVYGAKAVDLTAAEVDVYISVDSHE